MSHPAALPEIPRIADPLAEALHYLRMDGVFYCRSELAAPWGLWLPPMPDSLFFHVITSGGGWVVDSAGNRQRLRRGDVTVLPHGVGHELVDEVGTPAPSVFDLPQDDISERYSILRHGGDGEPTTMICGAVRFGHPVARSLVTMLPAILHVDGGRAAADWPWLPGLLGLMAAEAEDVRPGGEAVITRLSDILVIQAIRAWIDTDPAATTGWLGALRDERIGRAIALIHRHPEREWTVAALAAEVAMSRSGFSARFSELVGESAMHYVTRWRMHLAADLLVDQRLTVAQAATQLGYGSEAAFSRAFKRVTGRPPSELRRDSAA